MFVVQVDGKVFGACSLNNGLLSHLFYFMCLATNVECLFFWVSGTQPVICKEVGERATCEKCPNGTFADKQRYTTRIDRSFICQNHTSCSSDGVSSKTCHMLIFC